MAALYLDSSSVVKRCVAEVGSGWIRSITDTHEGNFCWLSSLARVELLSALYLRVRTGTLSRADAQSGEYQFRAELPTLYYLVPCPD